MWPPLLRNYISHPASGLQVSARELRTQRVSFGHQLPWCAVSDGRMGEGRPEDPLIFGRVLSFSRGFQHFPAQSKGRANGRAGETTLPDNTRFSDLPRQLSEHLAAFQQPL